jgi:UDP-N-acetylglucosamine 4-epimerase
MKILITGGVGFIGSNLCSHLLNEGHEVMSYDSLVNPSIDPTDRIKAKSGQNWDNFTFFHGDIRDMTTLQSAAAMFAPDVIIHLAALGSVPRSFANPSEVLEVNCVGFSNVMMVATMLNVKRVVFASSSSVYGDSDAKIRSEETIGNPLSPYALSKRMNEQFAEVWCKGIQLQYVGLRFFNVYGAGQLPDSPYSAVVPRFLTEKSITIHGDGETVRDFTYVDDVCEAIELALTTDKTNDVYNVCSGNGTTLNYLSKICSDSKKDIKHIAERPMDIKHSIGAPFKSQLFLKFKASYDIETGIAHTRKYYESLKGIHNL